jgi:hypothetical protein
MGVIKREELRGNDEGSIREGSNRVVCRDELYW